MWNPDMSSPSDPIRDLLLRVKTIAVVGLSSDPMRPSFGVSQWMQRKGYRIIPVNPNETEVLGARAYGSLAEIPEQVDLVDVFRRPQFVPEVVDEAIRLNIPAIWLQEGVVHKVAAQKARDAGLTVVMDLCILKEHRARFR
jgi:predicted CoA-binding protein